MQKDDALTVAQERFCLYVFQGKTLAEAKRLAYPRNTQTGRNLATEARRLMQRPRIQRRMAELRAAFASPAIAALVERQEDATAIMRDKAVSHRDRLAANRLLGEYAKDLGQPVTNIDARSVTINADVRAFLQVIQRLALTPEQLRVLDEMMAQEAVMALPEGER